MKVADCGTVGSGKSSLLSCILGEMQRISGTIRLCGRKACVAQSPWIPSGKIEGNILFGKDMNRVRYNTVLQACSLKKDLEILPCGDQTVIGERHQLEWRPEAKDSDCACVADATVAVCEK
ncbi:hypothetical protein MLD38_023650 [Melastoma candidum]|uniref:Uncharacterized protein n=1 Tax=Melastoma candidum TaxID=119954 RepID=A0ACB9NR76_9MYRT|nr:hypothetical protein MLD38_023650 [Melastoma candidum]